MSRGCGFDSRQQSSFSFRFPMRFHASRSLGNIACLNSRARRTSWLTSSAINSETVRLLRDFFIHFVSATWPTLPLPADQWIPDLPIGDSNSYGSAPSGHSRTTEKVTQSSEMHCWDRSFDKPSLAILLLFMVLSRGLLHMKGQTLKIIFRP